MMQSLARILVHRWNRRKLVAWHARCAAWRGMGAGADVILGVHFELVGVRQQRWLEAIKVRNRAPLPGLHSFTIDGDGATVCPRLEASHDRTGSCFDCDDWGARLQAV